MISKSIDTPLALVERTNEDLIRVRVKEGVRIDVTGLAAIRDARKQLAAGEVLGVVGIVPEDLDFDARILNVDHHAGVNVESYTRAIAIVSQDYLYHRVFALYTTFFAQHVPMKMFHEEKEALVWLRSLEALPQHA